jgi:hypothetical protein
MSHKFTYLTMIILQLSRCLALISSYMDRREAISETQAQDSTFILTKNLIKQLVLVAKGIFKLNDSQEKTLKDRLSLTLESKMFLEDLPMRKRPVKSSGLHLTFSSSSELEELLLEKSRSLRAAHARDIIFWNFFFFLSLK